MQNHTKITNATTKIFATTDLSFIKQLIPAIIPTINNKTKGIIAQYKVIIYMF